MNSSLSSKRLPVVVAGLLLLILGLGCLPAPEVGEELDPDSNQTPDGGDAGVTFTEVNQTILQPKCATSGCHGDLEPMKAPVSFHASVVYENLVGKAAAQQSALNRIQPGEPEASYLLHKVKGTAASVGGTPTRMPPGNRPALSAAELALIEAWISRGAPND